MPGHAWNQAKEHIFLTCSFVNQLWLCGQLENHIRILYAPHLFAEP